MNANADARQFNRKNAPGITIKEQPSTTAIGDRRPETGDRENMARYYRLARTSHKNARNQML